MGNEASSISLLSECSIDDSPIVTSEDWTLHHAQRDEEPTQLSVYITRTESDEKGRRRRKRQEDAPSSHLELLEKVCTCAMLACCLPSLLPLARRRRRRHLRPPVGKVGWQCIINGRGTCIHRMPLHAEHVRIAILKERKELEEEKNGCSEERVIAYWLSLVD